MCYLLFNTIIFKYLEAGQLASWEKLIKQLKLNSYLCTLKKIVNCGAIHYISHSFKNTIILHTNTHFYNVAFIVSVLIIFYSFVKALSLNRFKSIATH